MKHDHKRQLTPAEEALVQRALTMMQTTPPQPMDPALKARVLARVEIMELEHQWMLPERTPHQ